jgi:tetratricopeptide (TPR) repeat protein
MAMGGPPVPAEGAGTAQAAGSGVPPGAYGQAIPLFTTGLGPYARPISSSNPRAQAFFNQGVQMMYAFAKPEAVRSFRQAWASDPTCAICHWGEAWAWGSYLNAPMVSSESPWAFAAIQQAMRLREAHASPVERALIEAMSARYVAAFDPATRRQQDEAYAEAMRQVAERYPDDLDAVTLYGEALFLLEPRRGERDAETPNVRRMLEVFERVLAHDIRHPGACHLYVHATEATQYPGRAEACAEFLGDAVPGASHINHMPSHTWSQIGRWGDAVRANIQAWHSDLKAAVGEGFAIYPTHNLHMLTFAASMDGQGAIAIQAGKDYAKLTDDTMYHALALVRFGRFDEIPAVVQPTNSDVSLGLWEFAQGYACLRGGDLPCARAKLARVLEIAAHSQALFRFHHADVLLGTVGGILEGEIARDAGDLPAAIVAFERAAAIEDELVWDEPEPLPFAARHWLGAALLEGGRHADAERAYRQDLVEHPHNGWSLLGLQQALAGQGRTSAEVDADLKSSWARSDTWIRSSRF